ncbi:Ig-like domain-containing protein [Petrimonas mucosa]|jgi:hypothetical protein|uniref:BIG2 domain-containing protein n=1 Tax=Petrimonas mucosa TaxID=1642646 RepID=A0A1G4G3U4_9BACT|nr:Ig-like domain-containing protein [Petrimonas mucosa]SCM55440.1 hypothetical protein ING2E5A_0367 [Petrimonas mucosa]
MEIKIKRIIFLLAIFTLVAGISTSCKEEDKTMRGIALNMSKLTLDADAIEQVRFYPIPWDAPLTEGFTWKSENTEIVKVNNKGQVLGVNPGTTNITCECMGFSVTIPVTVRPLVSIQEKIRDLNAKGFWEFDDPNDPAKATIGADLIFVEDQAVISVIDGPRPGDGAVRIPMDPKKKAGNTTGTFIKCLHGFAPKGGKNVNEYTIMWDIRLPAEGPESSYYSLMSSRTLDNSQDQDICIRSNGSFGIGSLGYCDAGTLKLGKWHRVIVTMNSGVSVVYVCDGAKVKDADAASAPIDGRFSLLPGGVLFFADDDGDDSTIDVCNIAIWDRQLTEDEAKSLGAVRQIVEFEE